MAERIIAGSPRVGLIDQRRPHPPPDLPERRPTAGSCPERHILAAATSGFITFTSQAGGDAGTILEHNGLTERHLLDPKLKIDLGAYCSLFEEAARSTHNTNFGLWFGQQFVPERLGLIGDIVICSPTLRAALVHLAELFALYQQVTRTRLVWEDGLLRLEYQIVDGRIVERRQDSELTMGMFVNIFRHCLGPCWAPDAVYFEHPRPEDWRDHNKAFDAEIFFEQRCNALVFHDRDLDRPMPRADLRRLPKLCTELTRICRDTGALTLLDRLSAEIRCRLPEGPPHIDDFADQLGMTRRTLQRRLSEHDLTFSELIDRTRRTLAQHYLRQAHLSIADVATLLGFAETAAFSRACRGWFGGSPKMVRAALLLSSG